MKFGRDRRNCCKDRYEILFNIISCDKNKILINDSWFINCDKFC